MRNRKNIYSLVICITLILLSIVLINAQEVPHHNNLVDHSDPHICLTCHDGAIAENISPCTKASCLLDSNSSHPVFKQYPPDGKESEFHPSFQIEAAGIKLTNGEITCISCHDLIVQEEFHLALENRSSLLCMVCHKR
jgi:hypothetical protein